MEKNVLYPIISWLNDVGLSYVKLARKLKIPRWNFKNWLEGTNRPSLASCSKIIEKSNTAFIYSSQALYICTWPYLQNKEGEIEFFYKSSNDLYAIPFVPFKKFICSNHINDIATYNTFEKYFSRVDINNWINDRHIPMLHNMLIIEQKLNCRLYILPMANKGGIKLHCKVLPASFKLPLPTTTEINNVLS